MQYLFVDAYVGCICFFKGEMVFFTWNDLFLTCEGFYMIQNQVLEKYIWIESVTKFLCRRAWFNQTLLPWIIDCSRLWLCIWDSWGPSLGPNFVFVWFVFCLHMQSKSFSCVVDYLWYFKELFHLHLTLCIHPHSTTHCLY